MRHVILLTLCLLALPLMAAAKGKAPARPINLNTATATELAQLPGIGGKTAERILAWRKEHGSFKRVEEIMNVKGVGEKSFQRIKAHLTLGQAPARPEPAK